MATSTQVIINLSEKKIGTSFVFQLFRENFSSRNSAEIFVPGLKEYYFFPERTENYSLLPERLIKYVYNNSETFNKDDLVFMLSILAYDRTRFTEKFFASRDVKGQERESIRLCFERFYYLHRYAIKSHKSIYISDTNFQRYMLGSNSFFQKLVIKTYNLINGKTKFFCVIRDPKASIISLLKTQSKYLKEISEDGARHFVRRYNQFKRLKTLLVNCDPLISSVLLVDFDFLTNDTTNAFKVICDFLELPTNGKFVIPENPNPSKELSKEYQDDLSKLIPFIDEAINQQIDISDYKKLSQEKFFYLKPKK